ncbi:DUF4998 domain-containing protein [Christiangramia crocea]|uniref:DUF5013 domain-containing protein n=1 Tax=Christiangramia crocea TaxID=2904124 RepID=A0A9X2A8V0_9FLAO|nr:DUF4998 domain-containing protein [Gramella crocea]MCG9972842.1 DUF5013 domain-containing protein [Gramella crocea]
MRNFKYIVASCLIVLSIIGIVSCSEDNKDYLKYVENGETLYLAKVDSLEVFPGKNRVKIEGLIIGDPKVSEVRVYWNGQKDSVVVPIERTQGTDMFSKVIDGLEENVYNFQFRTFDDQGHKSIMESVTAEVYGDRYITTLFNRPIEKSVLIENDLAINFAAMDLSSGVIGSEVKYTTTAGTQNSVFLDIDDSVLDISDYENGSTFSYRTAFLPIETAIDTFYTEFEEIKPIPTPVLGNAAVPFIAAEADGRWGTLGEPWITNDAAKTHNGYGGWDEWNGNIFNLESGWGSPDIINGKIYQIVMVEEPATYQLKVSLMNNNHLPEDEGGKYIVVAKGDGLPDVENITTASEIMGYKRILEGTTEYTVEFTTEEEMSEISVGLISTQIGNKFSNILSWEIIVAN